MFSGQTNLSRIDSRFVDFSVEHDIAWGISFDGPPQLNDKNRILRNGNGTLGCFENACHEFPEFVSRCGVMSTITSTNDDQLLQIARYFRDASVGAWEWSLFQPIGRGRENAADHEFSVDRLLDSWNQLFDAIVSGEFNGFPVMPVLHYGCNRSPASRFGKLGRLGNRFSSVQTKKGRIHGVFGFIRN